MDMKVVPVPCHMIFETSLPVGNCIFILPYAQGFLRKNCQGKMNLTEIHFDAVQESWLGIFLADRIVHLNQSGSVRVEFHEK